MILNYIKVFLFIECAALLITGTFHLIYVFRGVDFPIIMYGLSTGALLIVFIWLIILDYLFDLIFQL